MTEGGYLVPTISDDPISKWQFFKGSHFPQWFIKKFPVIAKRTYVAESIKRGKSISKIVRLDKYGMEVK